jgi:hypothetical protein
VSGHIFGLSSREVEVVQIFLHNECLQKISESLTNALDKIKITFNLMTNVYLEVKTIEELEIEAHDDCKFEYEDHDSTLQDNQDSIGKDFKQKDQNSTHQDNQDSIDKDSTLDQEDQDNHHHNNLASLDTINHQEALMKIIL